MPRRIYRSICLAAPALFAHDCLASLPLTKEGALAFWPMASRAYMLPGAAIMHTIKKTNPREDGMKKLMKTTLTALMAGGFALAASAAMAAECKPSK